MKIVSPQPLPTLDDSLALNDRLQSLPAEASGPALDLTMSVRREAELLAARVSEMLEGLTRLHDTLYAALGDPTVPYDPRVNVFGEIRGNEFDHMLRDFHTRLSAYRAIVGIADALPLPEKQSSSEPAADRS